MKLATTTSDFGRFAKTYQERIDLVCEAGFKYIDLGMYIIHKNDELIYSDKWQDNAKIILEHAQKRGAEFVQAHAPDGNSLSGNKSEVDELIKKTIRSIDICGILGIPNIVVHQGVSKGISKGEFFERNKNFYEKLFPAMERNNVNVLCENQIKKYIGDIYNTNSGSDIKELVKYVDHPLFHACWDIGHANCDGSQYDEILAVGDDLFAVHINDNRGQGDEHLMPYFGTVNMDEIMNALINVNFKGVFTFECANSLRASKHWLGNRREFEKDNRLIDPQLFMQKHIEKLLYEIGRYILTSYNCFEG